MNDFVGYFTGKSHKSGPSICIDNSSHERSRCNMSALASSLPKSDDIIDSNVEGSDDDDEDVPSTPVDGAEEAPKKKKKKKVRFHFDREAR